MTEDDLSKLAAQAATARANQQSGRGYTLVPMVPGDIESLVALARQARKYRWLLSELHGGNEFSKDQLWKWLTEVDNQLG